MCSTVPLFYGRDPRGDKGRPMAGQHREYMVPSSTLVLPGRGPYEIVVPADTDPTWPGQPWDSRIGPSSASRSASVTASRGSRAR